MKKTRIIFVSLIIIMKLFVVTTFATTSVTIDGLSFSKEKTFYHNAIIDTETGNVITPSFIENVEEN